MTLISEKTGAKPVQWKKLLLSTIISGVTMWFVAGLWHTILAVNFFKNETNAAHEGIGIIAIAYVILAFFMTYLYQMSYQKKTITGGLVFGGIIGLLWVFPHELAMVGAHGGSISYVIKNAIWHTVEQGIGGVVIALTFTLPKNRE